MGYLVYTIGTLIVAPEELSVRAAIGGGCFVAAFVMVLVYLCLRTDRKLAVQQAAGGRK